MLKKFRLYCCAVLFCGGVFSGCSIFMPVSPPEMRTFQIGLSPMDSMQSCNISQNKEILQITSMQTASPYNNKQMFYSKGQYHLASYNYNEWISDLGVMLTQSIQQALIKSCIYDNVVSADFMTLSQYRLNTQLVELRQVMPDNLDILSSGELTKNISVLHFAVIVQLVDNLKNKVIKSKVFVEEESITPDAKGYVMGTNKVTEKFLSELIQWLKVDNIDASTAAVIGSSTQDTASITKTLKKSKEKVSNP